MRWDHPAFGPEEAGRESAECQQQAWMEAQRQSFMFGGFSGPRYVRSVDGRLHYRPDAGFYGFQDRQMAEMQLANFCMRNKGFRLVPAG